MFDGELAGGECELLARRLARDPALRRKWARHALVGAVVRGDREVVVGEAFAQRLSVAIAAEPAYGEPAQRAAEPAIESQPAALARWRRPLAAVGVAASVAVASILLLRAGPVVAPGSTPLAANASKSGLPAAAPAAAGDPDPASYVVPAPTRAPALGLPAAQLANYVVAHSEFSSPLGRRNLLSALMAGESVPAPAPAASARGGAATRGGAAVPQAGVAAPQAGVADGSSLFEAAGAGNAAR